MCVCVRDAGGCDEARTLSTLGFFASPRKALIELMMDGLRGGLGGGSAGAAASESERRRFVTGGRPAMRVEARAVTVGGKVAKEGAQHLVSIKCSVHWRVCG